MAMSIRRGRLKRRDFTGLSFLEPAIKPCASHQGAVPRETKRALDKLCTSLWVGRGWNAHNCSGAGKCCFYPQLQPKLRGSRSQAFLPRKCLFFHAPRQLSTSLTAIYYYDYFFKKSFAVMVVRDRAANPKIGTGMCCNGKIFAPPGLWTDAP
ncbi:hypothetical protein [Vandammella animalimorsus]|uniref:hypothetical protein n=1 Tax=Vandammella animalimorsus TaxID=2029117 RepID=UPI0011776FE6|nr:hypothetical protein [Vandammella animalimorsus]